MFNLIRRGTWRELLSDELPALAASLGVAEAFFKFHSFVLEGMAFLALWYALGAAIWAVRTRVSSARLAAPGVRGKG